jgi:hypothetical protein
VANGIYYKMSEGNLELIWKYGVTVCKLTNFCSSHLAPVQKLIERKREKNCISRKMLLKIVNPDQASRHLARYVARLVNDKRPEEAVLGMVPNIPSKCYFKQECILLTSTF